MLKAECQNKISWTKQDTKGYHGTPYRNQTLCGLRYIFRLAKEKTPSDWDASQARSKLAGTQSQVVSPNTWAMAYQRDVMGSQHYSSHKYLLDTPLKTNITNDWFFTSMFKNAQPYMLQFHVKEWQYTFLDVFVQQDRWIFSRIWRWFCKHGTVKRGDFVTGDRFYVKYPHFPLPVLCLFWKV